jgi:transposase InsO family protein
MENTVTDLCAALAVSRSGYYAWAERQASPRAQANRQLEEAIAVLFEQSRQSYGSPRMTAALRQSGHGCNHKRVERLMRGKGLKGRLRRRYRMMTTDSRHDQPIAPNRLAAAPPCTAPDQVWLTDITYVPTDEGWLYLAGVLDLYSRKLVGSRHGRESGRHAPPGGTGDGTGTTPSGQRALASLRSRRSIRQPELPGHARRFRGGGQHEPQRQLL